MVCTGIRLWTLSGLVVAFLDLGVAYILLCAAALAYLASKILGLFGLYLPCTCSGHLDDFHWSICVRRFLVDCPLERIYSVGSAVKYPTPAARRLAKDVDFEVNTSKKRKHYACTGYEGNMYSSSYLDRSVCDKFVDGSELRSKYPVRKSVMKLSDMNDQKFDLGTSETRSLMPRRNLSYGRRLSPISGKLLRVTPESDAHIQNYGSAPVHIGFQERELDSENLHEQVDESKPMLQSLLCLDEQWSDRKRERGSKSDVKDMITALEEALKEERAAQTALRVELEKERSAVATAADEAMAMILRLQEEKANIEMEARQYRRMIEEKSAYEAEEMNILREILMRREREKHCLENEVEAYRQMISGKQFPVGDLQDLPSLAGIASQCSGENSASIAQQSRRFSFGEDYVKAPNRSYSGLIPESGESVNKDHLHFSDYCDGLDEDFQEKGILAADENEFSQQRDIWVSSMSNYSDSGRFNIDESVFRIEEKTETNDVNTSWKGSASMATKIYDLQIDIPGNGNLKEKQRKKTEDLESSGFDCQPSFHDVHVIDDPVVMHKETSVQNNKQSTNYIPKMPTEYCSPTLRMIKSCSNMTSKLLPADHLQDYTVFCDKNRSFMNAVDYERSVIENEVEWLFKRLRILQENREKLMVSAVQNNNKGENIPLLVVEDNIKRG